MYKYKTKDGTDYVVPGFGATVNGEITTHRILENPNFILVSGPDDTATSAHVNGVVPQDAQSAPADANVTTKTESENQL